MGRRVVFDTTFRSYVNPEHIVCAACGKMIPKEAWVVGKQGKEFRALHFSFRAEATKLNYQLTT